MRARVLTTIQNVILRLGDSDASFTEVLPSEELDFDKIIIHHFSKFGTSQVKVSDCSASEAAVPEFCDVVSRTIANYPRK